MSELSMYSNLLLDIKSRLRQAQSKAAFSVNKELIEMYFDIGKMIHEKQKAEGWGSSVIPRLSKDVRNELPEIKGFSERNIGYMIRFAIDYAPSILQQPVAKLMEQPFFIGIPWGHHILLMEKIKDMSIRFWYMDQTVQNGWSRDTLASDIERSLYI